MIDRSYLPYQSAREFQDRGMAKWAGFFLSEHTTALHTKEIDRSQLTVLPLAEQIQLLEQAFQQQNDDLDHNSRGESICNLHRFDSHLICF